MELRKEYIGSSVYVKAMGRRFTVNEENKGIFFQFGHFNLFEDEPNNDTRSDEPRSSNRKGTKPGRSARVVPVEVYPRRDGGDGDSSDTASVD